MEIKDFLRGYREMAECAIAYVRDPEARTNSGYKYPNGNPISVREARKLGLMGKTRERKGKI